MGQVTEAELAAAWSAGDPVDAGDRGDRDCGDVEVRRSVDARLVRRFCLQRRGDVDPHGVRIRNAHLAGTVDLAGVELPFPVVFDGCTFEAAPLLDGADLHTLVITRSPGL